MRDAHRTIPIVLVAVLSATACGSGDSEVESSRVAVPSLTSMTEAAEAAVQAVQGLRSGGADGPRFSSDELRDRLPETAVGLPRVDLSAVTSGAVGLNVTHVTARYEGEANQRIEIVIVDAAGVPGMAIAGAAWASTSIDRTTSDGFERTTEFQGLRAFESEFVRGGLAESSLHVLAGSYLVQLSGRGVELETLRQLAGDLRVTDFAG